MPRSSRQTESDYEGRGYFRLLEGKVEDLEDKSKEHSKLLSKHHDRISDNTHRINTIWDHLYNPPAKSKEDVPPFFDDPRVRTGLKWFSLALLILAAAVAGINLIDIKGLL